MAVMYGYDVYPYQTNTTRLAVAVWLTDDYSGKPPIGKVKVFLKGQDKPPVENPSGYYLFLNLPNGSNQVGVESDYYFAAEVTVLPASLDPLNPVVEIRLQPKPSYPFLPGTTLIRGMVQRPDGTPVPGARLEILGKAVDNQTTEKGEFVLYFKGLKEDDLDAIYKKYIKGNGGNTLSLQATHGASTGVLEVNEVEVGQTKVLGVPIIIV